MLLHEKATANTPVAPALPGPAPSQPLTLGSASGLPGELPTGLMALLPETLTAQPSHRDFKSPQVTSMCNTA